MECQYKFTIPQRISQEASEGNIQRGKLIDEAVAGDFPVPESCRLVFLEVVLPDNSWMSR